MLRRFAFAALLCSVAGCFNPDKPTCSYVCADTEPKCPEDYECRPDGYCHLTGTTDVCPFTDAAMPLDMSANASDLPLTVLDLSMVD